MQGEFCTGSGTVQLELGEFCTGWAVEPGVLGEFCTGSCRIQKTAGPKWA